MGNPASITSIPNLSRALAIEIFSSGLKDTPGVCSPSLRVVSKKYAFSGGQPTLEEHRKKGGNPDIDVSFQYLKNFFEPDDKKLKQIYDDYKSGKLLTGELKQILIKKLQDFLKQHQKNMQKAKSQVSKFLD